MPTTPAIRAILEFSIQTPPDAPVLLLPEDEASLVAPVTFSWEEVDEANTYDLEIAETLTGTPTVTGITETEYVLNELPATSSDLSWRIRARNKSGVGDWCEARTGLLLPPAPAFSAPATLTDRIRPPFTWNTTTYANTYDLQVATTETFDAPLTINETDIAVATFTPASDLTDDTTYYARVRGVGTSGPGSWSDTLTFAINQWWLDVGTNLVPFIRHKASDFVNDATITSPAGGRTYLMTSEVRCINQDGLIRTVWAWVLATGAAAWKFKVFRKNGANYDMVAECAFTPGGAGLAAFNLSTPIVCAPGDFISLYLPENAQIAQDNAASWNTYQYADGDITTTNAFAGGTVASAAINFMPYGYQPFAVFIGDSIIEGHNTASIWHSSFHSGLGFSVPAGTPDAEIPNQMRDDLMPGFEYQNYSLGGRDYSWCNGTGFLQAFTTYALKANTWVFLAGINDIIGGRAWALVEADLDAIRTRCTTGDLWIGEILPWTTADDTQAGTTRTFNDNLATWCAANNARLILSHDAMGQLRVSTGELDDLITAYSQDGVHLTQAGVDAMAAIIKAAFQAVYLV